jgi:hypothetical protein
LEDSIIEYSITNSGTIGPNEDQILVQKGVLTHICTNETYQLLLGINQTTLTEKQFEYLIKMQKCHFTDEQ